MLATIIGSWSNTAETTSTVAVLPDGCSDLIVELEPTHWFVSSVQTSVEQTNVAAGRQMRGFRFRPGTLIDEVALLDALQGVRDWDEQRVLALIAAHTRIDDDVEDALTLLAARDASSVAQAARAGGVSTRTLQRVICRSTSLGPSQWMQLARVRRAGREVLEGRQSLADIAFEQGFSDQAHMTRCMRRWLGASPARLRQAGFASQLHATGYG